MLLQVFVVLIPITLILIVIIAYVFYRALHGGQFENLDEVSQQLLADDDRSVAIDSPDRKIDGSLPHAEPEQHQSRLR